jgi:hypothetical protein
VKQTSLLGEPTALLAKGTECPSSFNVQFENPMKEPTIWLGFALFGVLLLNSCSSGGGGVDAGTTTGTTNTTTTTSGSTSTTASGTSGTTGSTTGSGTGTTGSSTGSSTDGGIMMGTDCNPTAMPDTICAPAGYYCDPTLNDCQLPPEFSPCNATVGCVAGLSCVAGFGGANDSLCVQICSTSADCINPLAACSAVGSTSTKACRIDYCTSAYLPCNSGGSNDGTCIPTMGGSTQYCLQGGPIAANEPCATTRADGGGVDLCQVGSYCVGFEANTTACLSLCALASPTFPDGGPGCSANALCSGFTQGSDWGVCLLTCKRLADCPAPYTLCASAQGIPGMVCFP